MKTGLFKMKIESYLLECTIVQCYNLLLYYNLRLLGLPIVYGFWKTINYLSIVVNIVSLSYLLNLNNSQIVTHVLL